jgi:small GTP-binding protein
VNRPQSPLVKVVVAGASQVGKTSLVNKFVFDEFIDVTPTIGINFAQKIGYGTKGPLNLSIWDLSGEKRFRFLMPQFCSGATGVILVFDMARPTTLTEGSSWLDMFNRFAHPSHRQAIVLAGNKSDLRLQIPKGEIHQFCRFHNIAGYLECSAKTGKNVARVFELLCSTIQNNIPELSGAPKQYAQVM